MGRLLRLGAPSQAPAGAARVFSWRPKAERCVLLGLFVLVAVLGLMQLQVVRQRGDVGQLGVPAIRRAKARALVENDPPASPLQSVSPEEVSAGQRPPAVAVITSTVAVDEAMVRKSPATMQARETAATTTLLRVTYPATVEEKAPAVTRRKKSASAISVRSEPLAAVLVGIPSWCVAVDGLSDLYAADEALRGLALPQGKFGAVAGGHNVSASGQATDKSSATGHVAFWPYLDPAPPFDSEDLDDLRSRVHVFTLTNHYYTVRIDDSPANGSAVTAERICCTSSRLLCALPFASPTLQFVAELLRSAILHGYVPHVVGFGRGGVRLPPDSFGWHNGKPVMWFVPEMRALAERLGRHTLVIIADAHDVIFTLPARDAQCRFRQIQAEAAARGKPVRVLFSAERSCFPLGADECARFPDPEPDRAWPYRYLNTGAVMGEVGDVLDVLIAMNASYPGGLTATNINDQAAAQLLFINASQREAFGMRLDYGAALFMTMHMQHEQQFAHEMKQRPLPLPFSAQTPPPMPTVTTPRQLQLHQPAATDAMGVTGASSVAPTGTFGIGGRRVNGVVRGPGANSFPCNTVTRRCPIALHFNGGSKSLQSGYDDSLASTQATIEDTRVAQLVADYRVGVLGMTVREMVCDPEWTDDAASNKFRPAWIPGCRGWKRESSTAA